ncbi:hypothetical protein DV735_g5848, partial [Chaetothyriales sp. CBS 134920]
MEIQDFSSRKAVADIDCIAICPAYPEYLVYGTYTIVRREEDEDISAQVRTGTIQVLPVEPDFRPSFAGCPRRPRLCEQSFPAAVLDIRFHPNDGSLLGAALSDGTIHFFRFFKRADVLHRRWVTELHPLGHAKVAEKDAETGRLRVVTQFQWLPALHEVGRLDVSNTLTVTIAATLDSGVVKLLRTNIPAIRSTMDQRMVLPPVRLEASTETIHTHSLEAWCIALVGVPKLSNMQVLLSGGDDSNILVSIVTMLDPASSPSLSTSTVSRSAPTDLFSAEVPAPTVCFKGRRTHEAGVTAILPLPPPPTSNRRIPSSVSVAVPTPVLTGSYDDKIRLFCLSPTSHKLNHQPLVSRDLLDGVWRLQLMDQYTVIVTEARKHNAMIILRYQQHYIILVSCMNGGAKILRVIITSYHEQVDDVDWKWETEIRKEAEFIKGHGTVVYACDFVRHWRIAEPEAEPGVGTEIAPRRGYNTQQMSVMRYGTGLDGQCW